MSENPTITIIFESEAFTLSEFCCSSDCVHKKHEEVATAHEIVFPQKGYFQCWNALGKTQGDPNRVLFFNKDQPFEIDHPLGGGDVSTIFTVKPSIIKEMMRPIAQERVFSKAQPFQQNYQAINLATGLKHYTILRRGLNISRENILGFEESVLEFLSPLFDQKNLSKPERKTSDKITTREAHRALMEKTILYLNKHYCKNFTVSSLAKKVNSSPFHLCRIFREETGLTLHNYISGLRLRTALNVLRKKDMSLTELALDLGYSSHSHFSSSFRQAFSLSPKAYRNL